MAGWRVVKARLDPKIDISMPGAYASLYEALLAVAAMLGSGLSTMTPRQVVPKKPINV